MLLPYTKRETALGDSARMIVALHNLRVADKCKQKCVHKTINGPNTDCTDRRAMTDPRPFGAHATSHSQDCTFVCTALHSC
jgi:hypothetical protein